MSILFIPSSPLGDTVLSTGLLDYAQRLEPECPVVVAASPLSMPLFEDWPGIRHRFLLQRKPWAAHWRALWSETVPQTWDWIIDLRGSAFAYTVRAKKRWVWRPQSDPVHQVEKLAKAFGLTAVPQPVLPVSQARRRRTQELLPSQTPVIAVAPVSHWMCKEWSQEHFVTLLKRLIQPNGLFPHAKIAVFAAEAERPRVSFFLEHFPQEHLLDFIGKVGLLDIFALFQSCVFFIGNDSGLMHLAAASGVPTLGLFGPTFEQFYGPYSPYAATVRTPEPPETLRERFRLTGDPHLMASLSVNAVEEAVVHLWNRVQASVPHIKKGNV